MPKDPVCGMEVNPDEAAGVTLYDGTVYYFCAPICKRDFDADPEKYAPHDKKNDEESFLNLGGY